MSETDRYIKAWGDRRARLFMVCAMIVGVCLFLRLWPNPWIAGLCFVGALIGAYGYYQFRCPRCHERFMQFPSKEIALGREKCRRCGLEKNAVPPDAGPS